jgi:hypothetical protein
MISKNYLAAARGLDVRGTRSPAGAGWSGPPVFASSRRGPTERGREGRYSSRVSWPSLFLSSFPNVAGALAISWAERVPSPSVSSAAISAGWGLELFGLGLADIEAFPTALAGRGLRRAERTSSLVSCLLLSLSSFSRAADAAAISFAEMMPSRSVSSAVMIGDDGARCRTGDEPSVGRAG